MQLPPDARSDEITLQVLECSRCPFKGLGVYEESRRGALETVAWEHTGYLIGGDGVAQVAEAIRHCPDPFNSRCECSAHEKFTRPAGRRRSWNGLDAVSGLEIQGTFRLYLN
jgi:hypothetical protein